MVATSICAISVSKLQAGLSYEQVVVVDNPFAYYRFGETAVTDIVRDEMGNHDGYFVNTPTVGVSGIIIADPHNTGVHFDRAQDSYVELTTLGDFGRRMFQGFTVEFWLKSNNASTLQTIIGSNNRGFATAFIVDVASHRPGELRLYFRDEGRSRYELRFYSRQSFNFEIFDDAWHHIVYSFDPNTSLVKDRVSLYVDAQQQAVSSTGLAGGTPDSFSNFVYPMILAGWNNRGTVQNFFDGSLDEVAFYNRPLSVEEVTSHYNAVVPEPATIEAGIDIDPDTLNLKGGVRWITCYIVLPEEYNVADIDSYSILLENEIEAEWLWFDEKEQFVTARFNRSEVQDILQAGEVELTISGILSDRTRFKGTDIIRVIDKGGNK